MFSDVVNNDEVTCDEKRSDKTVRNWQMEIGILSEKE